jgi:hypothetical protein
MLCADECHGTSGKIQNKVNYMETLTPLINPVAAMDHVRHFVTNGVNLCVSAINNNNANVAKKNTIHIDPTLCNLPTHQENQVHFNLSQFNNPQLCAVARTCTYHNSISSCTLCYLAHSPINFNSKTLMHQHKMACCKHVFAFANACAKSVQSDGISSTASLMILVTSEANS